MFSLFRKKPVFEFYTSNIAALTDHPVRTGVKEIQSVFKRIKTDEISIKKCPGIVEYSRHGYIISAWQDIEITVDEAGENYVWRTPLNTYDFSLDAPIKGATLPEVFLMKREAFYDHFPRENTFKSVIKINTPWSVKMPKGYALLFAPVWYDNETRFEVIPGILNDPDNNYIHVQIYWHVIGRTEIIKAGTPLVKLIPVPDEIFKYESRQATKEEAIDYKLKIYRTNNSFR